MPSSKSADGPSSGAPSPVVKEEHIEHGFIGKLQSLKFEYRPDIRDRAALERSFRQKFEALKRVHLSDGEFTRLLDDIVTPDVFTASRKLRERETFTRDDGTPLNCTLVNIKDWCKNSFEVVNQLRINTDYSHHRYDVLTGGSKLEMSREQLIGIIAADAKFMNERDNAELATIATQHGLATTALQAFVDQTLQRLILDGDALSELMEPLQLGWKARAQAETALMAHRMPMLNKRAQGREISGLSADGQ